MEVILDIKNIPKVMNPTQNDIIVFDGKTWYLTTKQDLLEDAYKLIAKAKEELENLKDENESFKDQVNEQLSFMSDAIRKIYEVNK